MPSSTSDSPSLGSRPRSPPILAVKWARSGSLVDGRAHACSWKDTGAAGRSRAGARRFGMRAILPLEVL